MEPLRSERIIRSWLYLFLNFVLGTVYFNLLLLLFSTAFSLMIILVGFPLLVFTLAVVRRLAMFNHDLSASLLDRPPVPYREELDLRGLNIWQQLAVYVSSPRTWLSTLYLFVQFPLGLLTFTAAMTLLPFAMIEAVLWLVGINMGMVTGRLAQGVAIFSHMIGSALLNADEIRSVEVAYRDRAAVDFDKPKNEGRSSRLAMDDSGEQVAYVLSDDGEILPVYRQEKAKRG